MAMTNKNGVNIPIGGDKRPLERELGKAKTSLQRFAKSVRSSANAWTKYSGVATGAMVATTAAIYKSRAAAIDSLAKTADALELTTQKFQALNHVGELNGVSSDEMTKAIRRVNRALGEAARKGGAAADALADTGLNIDDLISLSPDQKLEALASAIGQVENRSVQASIANDLFGRSGDKMLKVLNAIETEGLDPTVQKLDELGISISRMDAAKIEAANDAFFEARQVIEGAGNAFAVKLAPFVKEVSNQFTEAARQSGGFGDEIEAAIERGMRIAGKFADVLQGLKVVFKGVELIAVSFGAAVVSVFQLSMEALTKFADGGLAAINKMIDGLNKIPGVEIANVDYFTDSAFMEGLRGLGDASRNQISVLREELHALAMQEMPSDRVEGYLKRVQEVSSQMAKQVADDITTSFSGGDEGDDGDDGFAARLELIRKRFATEQNLKREHLVLMNDLERAHREGKFETDAEYYATKEMAERDHESRLSAIRKQGEDARTQVSFAASAKNLKGMASTLQQAGSLMDSNNKKSFERTKKVSLASSIAALPSAVIQSFQNGGGYPFGLIPAGLMLATGIMNINKIKKSSYGGGGSAQGSVSAGGGGGASAARRAAPQGPAANSTLTVEGINSDSLFDGETVRTLAGRLAEHQKNGGTVSFA